MSLKNRGRINNSIDFSLKEAFNELSNDTRIAQSKLVDEAIYDLLVKHNKDLKNAKIGDLLNEYKNNK